MSTARLHLGVALEGAGWHPDAWRDPGARPRELFSPRYWADLVVEAENGLLDFVTFEDSFGLQSALPDAHDGRTDQVRGRLDAVLLASCVAPLTTRIGLVPVVTVTHTEPFHVATALASLDHISRGRAGWEVRTSPRASDCSHFGRRVLRPEDLLPEAGEVVEVVRRLWDSWEDDAEIRDTRTGRFIAGDRLHHVDFEGRWFRVKGPLITPRPPQGQPLVTARAGDDAGYEFCVRHVDLAYVDSPDGASAFTDRLPGVATFADLNVTFGCGADPGPDSPSFTGTPKDLAELLLHWRDSGLTGIRLRPAVLPADLQTITREVVPLLQARGAFRHTYEAATLRGLLGLPRPASRYRTRSQP